MAEASQKLTYTAHAAHMHRFKYIDTLQVSRAVSSIVHKDATLHKLNTSHVWDEDRTVCFNALFKIKGLADN